MVEAKVFPEGAIQLICGSAGDLLDHLLEQDAWPSPARRRRGSMLKANPGHPGHSVRFNMEADSLNCSSSAPTRPGTEEFDLFVKEVVREMTTKAGQKCTAIRRTIVPAGLEEAVVQALSARLAKTVIGDPQVEGVRMGPLATHGQVRDVGAAAERIRSAAQLVYGGEEFAVTGPIARVAPSSVRNCWCAVTRSASMHRTTSRRSVR
jgi:oxepin-CoA hydrolase / 3-oxo-5,6-dehydrosuberyl-CoA semialdehyde dehydrogenase